MQAMNKDTERSEKKNGQVSWKYVIPFFAVLAILTVVAFIIPLRPTRSYSEKRNLAQFPEFSVEALVSGSYFDDITLWFSDTFPGREGWLDTSSRLQELHGFSDIYIEGDLPMDEQLQVQPTQPEATEAATQPPETIAEETVVLEEIAPPTNPVEEWGGVNAGDEENISFGGGTIQVEDSVFYYIGFSEDTCDRYAAMINDYIEAFEDLPWDVNVVAAPVPMAIGIMVEKEYQERLYCAPQDDTIDYVLSRMDDRAVKVDMFQRLIDHNDEYLYFRTDHHWTALGAYYAYEEICLELGMEPAPLDSFQELDQGKFIGSMYYKAAKTSKLSPDNVMSYIPPGDIEMMIYYNSGKGFEWPVVSDLSQGEPGTKYMSFIGGDNALSIVTNNSLPDAPSCLIIKESFGNPAVPFFTQNYHKVYVIDYRKFKQTTIPSFVEQYEIDDVIFINNMSAVESNAVCNMLERLCG